MINILVVDDEVLLQELLSERLVAELGATVMNASSGNEAIELIQMGNKFDLIVSDSSMPDGTGTDLLRYVTRQEVPALFIFFTGSMTLEIPPPNDLFLGIVEKSDKNMLFEKISYGIEIVWRRRSEQDLMLNEAST